MFRTEKLITRTMVRAEPRTLFIFGDNVAGKGMGGQAASMRGEINSVGICTKWLPSMVETAFFDDHDLPVIKEMIDHQFFLLRRHLAAGGDVVWPEDGIGTGRAQLQERAPRIWDLIEAERRSLEADYGRRAA